MDCDRFCTKFCTRILQDRCLFSVDGLLEGNATQRLDNFRSQQCDTILEPVTGFVDSAAQGCDHVVIGYLLLQRHGHRQIWIGTKRQTCPAIMFH